MLMINNQNELVEGKFIGKNIDKIIIGPNVTYIPENCFNGCKNLNEITFEGNINNIEAAAFMGCENLKTINANNINIIKDFAFYGCNNIVDFNVDENIANNIKFGSYNNSLSTYFELPEIGTPFNNLSWHKINLISKKGKSKDYFTVGDKKEIAINSETYHVQIIGFDHDDKSDDSGKTGITVMFKEIMTTKHNMNPSGKNAGGWRDSEMRTYLSNNIYTSLPSDLQIVIKTVNKKSDNGSGDNTTLNITKDKLFLLSLEEVGFTSNDVYREYVNGQGTKYEYFSNGNSRKKKDLSGDLCHWWLRSTRTFNFYFFFLVNFNGNWNSISADLSRGVVPAFCI